ncbi:MAG: glycosyltransferase [Chthoniobacteraceae bacterium]
MKSVLIIPTYNPGELWKAVLGAIGTQQGAPDRKLVIDSGSSDGTAQLARDAGFEVITIDKKDFDYGGTRQMGADLAKDCDLLIYMTQDVVLADQHALANLLKPFDDPKVGASYGRQLPRVGATAIETHARFFNYPPEGHVRDQSDIPKYGFKCAFFSDAFGAYRRAAHEEIGGFPLKVMFGEDTIAIGHMLTKGWKIAYAGDAQALHSHGYTIPQEFRRYFDIGVFHDQHHWMLDTFGKLGGEGLKFVKSESAYLLKHAPLELPSAWIRTWAKWLGYKAGLKHASLSLKTKRAWSMNRGYWK